MTMTITEKDNTMIRHSHDGMLDKIVVTNENIYKAGERKILNVRGREYVNPSQFSMSRIATFLLNKTQPVAQEYGRDWNEFTYKIQ